MSKSYNLHDAPGYLLTLLSRISERRFERGLAPLGLTRVKWCVLLAVGQENHHRPSEIAAFIGIDRTATSRALRGLEADGLITRSNGAGDGRTRSVDVTGAGTAKLAQANVIARQNSDHFADKLSWYERETLGDIVRKLMSGETRDVANL